METTENQTPAPTPTLTPDTTIIQPPHLPPKLTPVVKLLLVVGAVLLFLIVVSLLLPKPPSEPAASGTKPLPSTISNSSALPRQLSEFGKTADFMNFEATLRQLKTDVIGINLNESELTFPVLDMDVNFERR